MFSKTLSVLAPALALAAGLLGLYVLLLALDVEMVSWPFLLGFPALAGVVTMWFRPKSSLRTLWTTVAFLVGVMALSILGSLITGLEGMICIAMAMAPLLAGTLLGGVIYVMFKRWQEETHGAQPMVVLPVLALMLFNLEAPDAKFYDISDSVVIDAAPQVVFAALKSIPDIAPEEVPTRLSHWLGVPKPTSAVWDVGPTETIRHSYWGEDVHFHERITTVTPNRLIAWQFEFPEDWIADGIEDPHVKVGGPYFDILSGEYRLDPLGDKTRLTLTTRTSDTSKLGRYAEFWHRFFFSDFHEVILTVVKTRIEARG